MAVRPNHPSHWTILVFKPTVLVILHLFKTSIYIYDNNSYNTLKNNDNTDYDK